jgi:hypothetical protein
VGEDLETGEVLLGGMQAAAVKVTPIMRGYSWQPTKPRSPPKPKVADEVREAIDAQVASVVAKLKQRFCKKPKNPQLNWPDDLFTRWHRDALYFVLVMRTPHGRPPTFETHAARMEHAGNGKFNLAVPMRRGWNTVERNASPEECLEAVDDLIHY